MAIKQKAILPGENQKLAKAALIDLTDRNIRLIEKKYEVNGVKTNYFSSYFSSAMVRITKIPKPAIVTKAVDDVQKKFYHESEQFEVQMETKSIINQTLEEEGSFCCSGTDRQDLQRTGRDEGGSDPKAG